MEGQFNALTILYDKNQVYNWRVNKRLTSIFARRFSRVGNASTVPLEIILPVTVIFSATNKFIFLFLFT